MNNTMEIQVKNLAKSALNVRKTISATADEELKASILAHGLMQNLVVTEGKKGKYLVIAGARRLEALKSLIGTACLRTRSTG
jgi:ParB family chromosome partitioning protein